MPGFGACRKRPKSQPTTSNSTWGSSTSTSTNEFGSTTGNSRSARALEWSLEFELSDDTHSEFTVPAPRCFSTATTDSCNSTEVGTRSRRPRAILDPAGRLARHDRRPVIPPTDNDTIVDHRAGVGSRISPSFRTLAKTIVGSSELLAEYQRWQSDWMLRFVQHFRWREWTQHLHRPQLVISMPPPTACYDILANLARDRQLFTADSTTKCRESARSAVPRDSSGQTLPLGETLPTALSCPIVSRKPK